jgi:hypothetical protein
LIIANHVSNDAPGQGLSFAVHTTPRATCAANAQRSKISASGGEGYGALTVT